jgi:peptidoglycan/xylan/chitin deacetylase (PgdA/CDA1 family)
MMKSGKFLLLPVLFLLPFFVLYGINFHDLNLSNDDRLLFKADFENQQALFVSLLTDMSIQQLTAFPEKLQLVENGRTIMAMNRFGAVKIPASGGLPSPVPGYPSFAAKSVPLLGKLQELAASSDGKWVLHVEPTSPAYGNLLLIDTSNGVKRIISEKIELPSLDFPARWNPDSRYFVYSKGGRLFYFPIISDLSALVDERFRLIGAGGITSVSWGLFGDFYYLTGNTLYRVINPELFTRTVYGDFLSIGTVAASFPIDFDSTLDRYWISPDSGSILINKNEKSFFIFPLGANQNNAGVLPYATIPQGSQNISVLWAVSGHLAIVSSVKNEISVRRFETTGSSVRSLPSGNVPSSSVGALSPDGTRAAFWGETGIEIWDFANWRLLQRSRSEPVFSAVWVNNRQLISGNERFIEELTVSDSGISQRRVCLSNAEQFGFESGAERILAKMGNDWFATDGKNPWVSTINPQLRQVSLSSERYRVFLESQSSGHYKNIPMIRSVYSSNTVPLVSGHSINSAYFLGRQIQIALCFDLYDDDTGLYQVLAALRGRGIKATFFLNGDFIRRNPKAAAAIAEAGHETASLFYSPIDFSDTRYRITHEFIASGLARNEDEFFHSTGKELSPLWHPPYFRFSNTVITAASAAGYTTVTGIIDPGDWMSREESLRLNLYHVPAGQMIEQIIEKKVPGAIIPIRLGTLPSGRDGYLFQRIDVLLDALIRSGCVIVPVSQVINR